MGTFMTRKVLFLAAVISLLIVSSVLAQTLLPEDPARGARLFVNKGCVKCHALKGEGGKAGPDLGKIDLGDTQLDLAAKLWNHIPSMVAGIERAKIMKPHLTGEELGSISAYLYFLKYFDEPGDATRGKFLFNEKGCMACHPQTGKGKKGESGLNEFPQNISPVFLSMEIWNHGPQMIANMVTLGMKWPDFKETEMIDLLEYIKANAKGPKEIAYITPGNPKEGRRVFQSKGCIECHPAQGGKGPASGIDLSKRSKAYYGSLTRVVSAMWNKGPTVLAKMSQTKTGIPKFSPKEMADLISYLYFLHFMDEIGNPVNGKKSFSDLGCLKCHGIDGKRGELMHIDLLKYQKTTNPMEIAAGIWNHGGEIHQATKAKGIQWPRFKKGEMADVLEYLRTPKKK
ncbi:MAG: c-type cytochrome [Deltaproteobacteria bacterium]|nr:c-type cytochrome [Deltaproteobacteria bacterium]MBM4324356.1 c-type cytochrome [Deltaproteobacteria bacterium]